MVHNGAAATTATPSAGTPSILKRRRRSSSDTPTVGGEGPQQRAAKRIKFAPNDSVGACVDPVFSDYEDEDGGDADGGDADYKNGEVTKRANNNFDSRSQKRNRRHERVSLREQSSEDGSDFRPSVRSVHGDPGHRAGVGGRPQFHSGIFVVQNLRRFAAGIFSGLHVQRHGQRRRAGRLQLPGWNEMTATFCIFTVLDIITCLVRLRANLNLMP